MFNFTCDIPEITSQTIEDNSIWNSAGLTSSDFNPNLPEISALLQSTQESFSPSSSMNKLDLESVMPQFSPYMQPNRVPVSKFNYQQSSQQSFGLQSVSPKLGEALVTSQSQSVSPIQPITSAAAISKDPGYYSESECSSNSSEKESLSTTFAKSLQLEPEVALETAAAPSAPIKNDEIVVQQLSLTPTLDENVMKQLQPRFDSQSFDTHDLNFCGDEAWKAIKKPGREASLITSPDLGQNLAGSSEYSWSGNSSPALSASGSTCSVGGKSSFAQHTKQQVCVFCRNNGEDESVYSTHTLMSTAGKVICPILYAYKCPICHATGDYAHTLKYCPMMPKGLNTGTNPGTTSTKVTPIVSVLPKTATFPQHLSVNARQNMSRGTQNLRRKVQKFPFPQHQQMGMINNQPESLGSIAELQEAAQKILMFTNQIMSNQAPNNQQQNVPPQISQFLLKLDNKQNPQPNSHYPGVIDISNIPSGLPGSNSGLFNRTNFPSSSQLPDMLACPGQDYQPFQTMPQSAPDNTGFNSDVDMKIKEFLEQQGVNFNTQPANTNTPSDWFNSTPKPSNQPSMSSNFNASTPPFLPFGSDHFGSMANSQPSMPNMSNNFNPQPLKFPDTFNNPDTSSDASEELFKLLGINKAPGGNLPTSSNDQTSNEAALATILASLKDMEQNKNCG